MPRSERDDLSRPYRVFEAQQFLRDLDELDPSVQERLRVKLREHVYPHLETEPHRGPNIKRLQGWGPAAWRYRVGQWPLFYTIDDSECVVLMAAIEHRKEAYR
jgi:mRNA interferase RelE/StbE